MGGGGDSFIDSEVVTHTVVTESRVARAGDSLGFTFNDWNNRS